jgi:monoamine oxidase
LGRCDYDDRASFATAQLLQACFEMVEPLSDLLEGRPRFIDWGKALAALPPRLLEASVSFTPPLEEATARQWRETPTWMAPHAKFFALYDRPFWRDAGLSGTAQSMVGPMLEMHDATTARGDAALFGFLGIPAEQRAALGEERLARLCIEQFARIFGAEARSPRATLIKDWAADPLTATAADHGGGGHIVQDDEPWVRGVWQDRLTLGGSESSATEPGYLAGGLAAANRAVLQVTEGRELSPSTMSQLG